MGVVLACNFWLNIVTRERLHNPNKEIIATYRIKYNGLRSGFKGDLYLGFPAGVFRGVYLVRYNTANYVYAYQ